MNLRYAERIRKEEHKKLDAHLENKKRPQITIYGEGLPNQTDNKLKCKTCIFINKKS